MPILLCELPQQSEVMHVTVLDLLPVIADELSVQLLVTCLSEAQLLTSGRC